MITTAQDPRWLDWAAQRLGVSFETIPATWVTRLNGDGEPGAVAVFTRFSPHNCEISIATDGQARWLSREFMRVCYRYVFEQLQLARVTAITAHDNDRCLSMCRKLGFIEEGTLKAWFGSKDGVVMRMCAKEFKWL